MTFLDLLPRPVFAPADGDPPVPGAGDPPPAAGDPPVPGAGDPTPAAGDPPPTGKWWESPTLTAEQRQFLTVKGLTVDDQGEAIQKLIGIGQNADKRFGKPIDSVIDKPKDGQKITDWMREQGEMFGLPKSIEDIKIERPKDLAEGIAWDADFEGSAKKAAFELGLTGAQLQGMTALYAGRVQEMLTKADETAAEANTKMMADLSRDWGDQTEAKIAQARQAVGVVGQHAGLEPAAIEAVAQVLTTKAGGDAATIKLFAALGDMMSEDKMLGGGGGALGTTPAEARAKAAALRAPGGAFYEASAKGNTTEIQKLTPELKRLDELGARR